MVKGTSRQVLLVRSPDETLFEQAIFIIKEGSKPVTEEMLLQEADRYIREHYMEDISLADLAERCGLHPNYFHKLYTNAFGKTPAQKLLACRIAAAKMALLTGNKSMAEIAAACGFSSQTYFGYKFKQATGRTPLQYRKRILGSRKA